MFWKVWERYSDAGLLIIRLGFGLGFIYYHGWGKLMGGPERWAKLGGAMGHLGIDFGHTFFGFMAAITESLGALFFALGFLFQPVLVLLAFTMVVAAVSHLAGSGNPASALKNAFLFTGMIFTGPGRYSIDAWLSWNAADTKDEGYDLPESSDLSDYTPQRQA